MKKSVKTVLIFLLLAAVITALIFLTSHKKAKSYTQPVPSVKILKPYKSSVTESLTLSSYVEAKAMIPVVPFVQGTITLYRAKAGELVKKDFVLAEIDDAPYKQTFLQAQAAFWGYESTFKRVESLYKNGSTTQQNYDSTKAQRDAAKAQFDLASLQLEYTKVKSPIYGTILMADSTEGSMAVTGQPLAIIADLDSLIIKLKVPEKYYDLFCYEKDLLIVNVNRPSDKQMYEDAVSKCEIETIAPYISPETKEFEVRCLICENMERFKPGMYVKVNVCYGFHNNVFVMDNKARKIDGSFYLYDEETSRVKFVEGENIINDEKVFIVPDEMKDSFFVIDGQHSVFDGQKVNVLSGE